MAQETVPRGTLRFTVHQAKNLRDVQLIGKQDPYAVLTFAPTKLTFTTRVDQDSGKNPQWEQNFNATLTGKERSLDVQIFNKNATSDEFICIPLKALHKYAGPPPGKKTWFRMGRSANEKKFAGDIQLTMIFEPEGGYKKTAPKAINPVPSPGPAAQPVFKQVQRQPVQQQVPQQRVVYMQQQPQTQPGVVYPQNTQPGVVYQQPVQQRPNVVYQQQPQAVYPQGVQPQVVYMQQPPPQGQPQVVYAQPPQQQPQVVYMQQPQGRGAPQPYRR